MLEMLLSDHPFDCMTCDATGSCLLQDLVYEYGVRTEPYPGLHHHYPIDLIPTHSSRSTAISASCAGAACGLAAISMGWMRSAWSTAASTPTSLSAPIRSMQESPCEFCGSCVDDLPDGCPISQDVDRQGPPLAGAARADDVQLLRRGLPARAGSEG